MSGKPGNIDHKTVESFGDEWARYDQSALDGNEWQAIFDSYFEIFPWEKTNSLSEGFDMGSGSGRWAAGVAPRIGKLNCIDPSGEALAVARRNLAGEKNVMFHEASVDAAPLQPTSQDFGYSLGVLHHIPDTEAALRSCAALLKPGAPFLVYLYYRFDNRPAWFAAIWRVTELFRAFVKSLPGPAKPLFTDTLAALVYWPLARFSWLVEKSGMNPRAIPLSFYRDKSFYTMRTDSRDRFGTPLEQRFTRAEIHSMMERAGFQDIRFSDREPYWVACGIRK